eukprot:gnl/MRDRNA2_/MRDRNA2_18834_c0_seq1.p1 gnl/MRDRNA2_/MRDRNA2_18834_c0~~gnl/MRDRNA2_/MRDRNA2_18834_c0_seq1.p1  ORF type:complete len:797 (+),score=115.57 gnl/MRDRNA2_/MRDRNA2_18834_c0_seq1:116-2392(+)
MSANKILGLHGQEFPLSATGHQLEGWYLRETVVLIVSHSGGTFASLAVSNLLQSYTRNIFVVCSEWDTQVSKQLRAMPSKLLESRVFSTDIGVRPAEPCSISVVATHQLLTQILEHLVFNILPHPELRRASGCKLVDQDLKELERLNQDNVVALEDIVGVTKEGKAVDGESTSQDLRKAGEAWAQHVLEAPRSWILIAIYILVTVTSGYLPITGTVTLCLPDLEEWALWITRFADAAIYLFLPQIMVLLIRTCQKRPLLHRMAGRTIVIGDIPWVAQCSESFLSKLFACSYSIAGVTVLSANPTDHLVHRHTHKVVRGTLLAVGRPDGRLSALTSTESAVCLSMNQASSIQNLGVTCESITVGHNPSKLPLSARAIFIKGNRPNYLCEQLLQDQEQEECASPKSLSSAALLGAFTNIRSAGRGNTIPTTVEEKVGMFNMQTHENQRKKKELKAVFDSIDVDGSGTLNFEEFKEVFKKAGGKLDDKELRKLFDDADADGEGTLDFNEFEAIMEMDILQILKKLGTKNGEVHGLANVEPSTERYLGEELHRSMGNRSEPYKLVESQNNSMKLYESRVASMQRFVSFCVMFHELGRRVQDFWPAVSFGILGYRMDRTHSIMRIATTASPVSGAEVRDRMCHIAVQNEWHMVTDLLRNSLRRNVLKQQFLRHARTELSLELQRRPSCSELRAEAASECLPAPAVKIAESPRPDLPVIIPAGTHRSSQINGHLSENVSNTKPLSWNCCAQDAASRPPDMVWHV